MEDKNFSQDFDTPLLRLKPYLPAIILACIGLLLIGYGVITYFSPHLASNDITFETQKPQSPSVKNSDATIVVDVEGAVQKPGVYHLKPGDRVQDALVLAGGFSGDADKQQMQHSLNLAAKVTDGMKLYIPHIGEESSIGSTGTKSTTSYDVAGVATTGLISINSASAQELDTLPGVGKVTAEKIIGSRPYSSIEDLVNKKAVGQSVFEKIKDKISL